MSEEDAARMMMDHDTSGEDGWGTLIDTSVVDNGVYNILVGASDGKQTEQSPWTSYALKQVIVEN
jgi:hypothetical protein